MDVYRTFSLPIFLYGCITWTWTEVQMGRLEVTHYNRLRSIAGVKLKECHRLENIHEQCGTSSLELMVCKWVPFSGWGTYCEWMRIAYRGRFLIAHQQGQLRKMAGGTTEVELQSCTSQKNIKDFSGMYSSAIQGCHEESSGGGTSFRDYLKLPGHTKSIPWPEIWEAAAECALDRQAWQDAFKNLAPLQFKKPKQADIPGSRTRTAQATVGRPSGTFRLPDGGWVWLRCLDLRLCCLDSGCAAWFSGCAAWVSGCAAWVSGCAAWVSGCAAWVSGCSGLLAALPRCSRWTRKGGGQRSIGTPGPPCTGLGSSSRWEQSVLEAVRADALLLLACKAAPLQTSSIDEHLREARMDESTACPGGSVC
eukprot:363402-Chlamydomonas_euryale.AAC.6